MKKIGITLVVLTIHGLIFAIFMVQGCRSLLPPVESKPAEKIALPPPVIQPEVPPYQEKIVKQEVKVPSLPKGAKETPVWTEGTKEYIVAKGDTLSSIAAKFNVSVASIVALNGIKNPNLIRVGDKLIIPAGGVVSVPKTTTQESQTKQGTISGKEYTVAKGDCLSIIASKFGVTVKAIMEANGLKNDRIFVGQKLIIPEAGTVKSTPDSKIETTSGKSEKISTTTKETGISTGASNVSEPPVLCEHIVKEGETLSSIALTYLVTEDDIVKMNSLTSRTVRVGQKLKIPMQ